MDIERMKKLLTSGIEAGNKVKVVREVVKTYNRQKQDMYGDTAEILKPSIDCTESQSKKVLMKNRIKLLNNYRKTKRL